MPGYPFLARKELSTDDLAGHLATNQTLGVPYTDEMIENAATDALAQANPDDDNVDALTGRYDNVKVRDFDGDPSRVTELDAMIAYMQMLGTLVDFSAFKAEDHLR